MGVRPDQAAITRRVMQANRRRDTGPELAVRKRLHAAGARYRVDFAPTANKRRRADIVFTRLKIAVFVDGCFWHGCELHFKLPKSNLGYWVPKIQQNRDRDRRTDAELEAGGWEVLRFWGHEDPDEIVGTILTSVSTRGNQDASFDKSRDSGEHN